jgi:hypothetical protein
VRRRNHVLHFDPASGAGPAHGLDQPLPIGLSAQGIEFAYPSDGQFRIDAQMQRQSPACLVKPAAHGVGRDRQEAFGFQRLMIKNLASR